VSQCALFRRSGEQGITCIVTITKLFSIVVGSVTTILVESCPFFLAGPPIQFLLWPNVSKKSLRNLIEATRRRCLHRL